MAALKQELGQSVLKWFCLRLEAGTRLHWSHRFVSSFTRCVPETTFSIEKAIRVGIMGEQGKEKCHTLEAPEVNPHALDSGILSKALFL